MYHYLFIHSPINEHLNFPSYMIMNKTDKYFHVQFFLRGQMKKDVSSKYEYKDTDWDNFLNI